MKREDVQYDQRVRVNVPGMGDHGHVGTVKRIRGGACSVHLDRDQRPRHLVVFFAADLDRVTDERLVGAAAFAADTGSGAKG